MTRTITLPHSASGGSAGSTGTAVGPPVPTAAGAAAHAAAGDGSGGESEGVPPPGRSGLPDSARRSFPAMRQGRRTVLWRGPAGALRELVRDHTTAAGLDLIDGQADSATVCAVLDAAALADGADGVGTAEFGAGEPGQIPRLLVTGSAEVPAAMWRVALALGARAVVPLPAGSDELLTHLADLARPRSTALLLGVVGGCGGAGASSFAARLAAAARSHGPVTLVDADPLGGGADLLVEAPDLEGIRWREAAGLGPEDGEALRAGLPQVDEVRLLVAGEGPGPTTQTLPPVLAGLAALGGTAVVDLGPTLVPAAAGHLAQLLVVTPSADHAVRATARRLRSWQLPAGLARSVVRRTGPLSPHEVADDLDLPLAADFRDSSRGTVPLLDVRRGGADRAARELLARLHTGVLR